MGACGLEGLGDKARRVFLVKQVKGKGLGTLPTILSSPPTREEQDNSVSPGYELISCRRVWKPGQGGIWGRVAAPATDQGCQIWFQASEMHTWKPECRVDWRTTVNESDARGREAILKERSSASRPQKPSLVFSADGPRLTSSHLAKKAPAVSRGT